MANPIKQYTYEELLTGLLNGVYTRKHLAVVKHRAKVREDLDTFEVISNALTHFNAYKKLTEK